MFCRVCVLLERPALVRGDTALPELAVREGDDSGRFSTTCLGYAPGLFFVLVEILVLKIAFIDVFRLLFKVEVALRVWLLCATLLRGLVRVGIVKLSADRRCHAYAFAFVNVPVPLTTVFCRAPPLYLPAVFHLYPALVALLHAHHPVLVDELLI